MNQIPTQDVPQLPTEICEQIFQHLNFHQLVKIRQTCTRWKDIVDGRPTLMEQFHLKFPENSVMNRKFQHSDAVPARNITFTKWQINSVCSWWTEVGVRLVYLKLDACKIGFKVLLQVLQETPNLKRLDFKCSSSCNVNCSNVGQLRLDKVEHLSVDLNYECRLLEVFGQIFPRLKCFEYKRFFCDKEKELFRFLDRFKDTLEEIYLPYANSVLHRIRGFKQLKRFEAPKGALSNEELCQLGSALPKLTSITVNMPYEATLVPTFLETMPNLEYLSITRGSYRSENLLINLDGFGSPNLKHLHLNEAKFVGNSFQHFCKNSLNIRELTLTNCCFKNWSDIFTLVEQLKSLERLELSSVLVTNDDDCLSEYLDNLKCLKLVKCALPKTLLQNLFSLCPRLENCRLESVDNVDDEVILEVCQKTKQLEHLTIIDCPISDVATAHVIKYCKVVEKVRMVNCRNVSLRNEDLGITLNSKNAKEKISIVHSVNQKQILFK